jgi:hypothetical protein
MHEGCAGGRKCKFVLNSAVLQELRDQSLYGISQVAELAEWEQLYLSESRDFHLEFEPLSGFS